MLTTASAPAAVPSELILNAAAVAAAPTPEGWVMGKVMVWVWMALTGGRVAGAVALSAGLSRTDLDAIQGEWVLESSFDEFDPAGCAPPAFGRSFVIAGDSLVPDPKTVGGRLTVTLDTWKWPRQIDLTADGVRDLADGQVVRGVYAVRGDTLTLNVAVVDGQPRPTHVDGVELYSRAGEPARMGDPAQASRLFVLKRVKK